MMKEEEMIDLLRHYRHDWLNDVQLLLGYTSMGKIDKVERKLKEVVEIANNERKLEKLAIPKTTLWIVRFNWKNENYRINYEVSTNKKLSDYDDLIYGQFQLLMNIMEPYTDKMELYSGMIIFSDQANNEDKTEVEISFSGRFLNVELFENELVGKSELHKVKLESISEDKYKCTLICICN